MIEQEFGVRYHPGRVWSILRAMGWSPQKPERRARERDEKAIQALHRHLRRKFILILDRYSAHRKAVRLLQEAHPDWVEVVWLPAYAPELNPVEMVWSHSKYGDLANCIPTDLDDLKREVKASLERTGSESSLLMACFRRTGLKW